jgi:hypothetical protein
MRRKLKTTEYKDNIKFKKAVVERKGSEHDIRDWGEMRRVICAPMFYP